MAIIHNSEVITGIQRAAKIQSGSDSIPRVLASQVIPSIEVNPILTKEAFIKVGYDSTSGSITLYTTPTNQDVYVTAAYLSIIKNAACDVATGPCSLSVVINGATVQLLRLPLITLTAQEQSISISFPHPIKIDRGTSVSVAGSFTAGVYLRAAGISAFADETSNA